MYVSIYLYFSKALDHRMFSFVSDRKFFVISDLRNGQRDGQMQHLVS